MEKFVWKGKIKKGMMAEYIKRHDNLWHEMKDMLNDAGITNYSIWSDGENLFGYYECMLGVDYALSVQSSSPIVHLWNEYMADIIEINFNENAEAESLKQVFEFN